MKEIMNKKALSPVIATVLLVSMVVVIGLIIFLWFSSIIGPTITKFGEENIELACDDVNFDASYSSGLLSVSNLGNVPIFNMKMAVYKEGSFETKSVGNYGDWPDSGLNQGGTFSGDISSEITSGDEVVLIPVLMGTSSKGRKTFICNEQQHGMEVII